MKTNVHVEIQENKSSNWFEIDDVDFIPRVNDVLSFQDGTREFIVIQVNFPYATKPNGTHAVFITVKPKE